MSATAEAPTHPRLTRDQAADRVLELLGEEPMSAAELSRRIMGEGYSRKNPNTAVRSGLDVLESRGLAKRIPRLGWTRIDSQHQAVIPDALEVRFTYTPTMVRCDQMFVDRDYQRPLTTFWAKIRANFDEDLFQPIYLSDRGPKSNPRYAIIDGQTRWKAATDLGIAEVPCNIKTGLTPKDEARLFSRLQTQRKGMMSWHRFRADLRAEEPLAVTIWEICEMIGYKLGDGEHELKAIGALEACARTDVNAMERALADLKEAFPDAIPEAPHIRGVHYFLRNYPIGQRKHEEVNDQKLINRLRTAGLEGLKRRVSALKESGEKGDTAKLMGLVLQKAYAPTK